MCRMIIRPPISDGDEQHLLPGAVDSRIGVILNHIPLYKVLVFERAETVATCFEFISLIFTIIVFIVIVFTLIIIAFTQIFLVLIYFLTYKHRTSQSYPSSSMIVEYYITKTIVYLATSMGST